MNLRLPSALGLLLALACAPLTQAVDTSRADIPAAAQTALDQAEALHLRRNYPAALAAYDRLIAQQPDWLRPRYLRWILRVDMGDLPALEKELGLEPGASFEATLDGAVARLPKALTAGRENPRPWLHQVLWRYLAASADRLPAGEKRDALVKRILAPRDLPAGLRPPLEDLLPELDRAEAAHLSHRYATALTRYDRIIAARPGELRPHYLRWIMLVDMGALSILHRELGLDSDLPFDASLDAAMAHLPPALRNGKENPRPWLHQVALRYYEIKPTHVANRGDMELAVDLARRALEAPGLPKQLEYELRENLVVYLGDGNRFADTVAAADALEKQYGEPVLGVLSRKASALESLGRHADAIAVYRRILERAAKDNRTFIGTLPWLRGEYTAWRNAGDLRQARALLQKIADNTAPPQPARKGCAPDWSGDYAWIRLQEVRLLMQENRLAEADEKLAAMETDFAGSPEVAFLRANLEHLRGHPRKALAFYHRLEAEQTEPDPRILAGRMAAQSDLGPQECEAARQELARWRKAIPDSQEFAALAARFARMPPTGGHKGQDSRPAPDPEKIWDPDIPWNAGEVLVLCYHDIPDQVQRGDTYGVDVETFVSHLELLKARGFHFVRLSDVIAAHKGGAQLPPKSVLLTFDDGYKSHHDNLPPILELYRAPAVLAAVTQPSGEKTGAQPAGDFGGFTLMGPQDWRELGANPLFEFACHSRNLHQAAPMNAFGNSAPAAVARIWRKEANDGAGGYETDAQYAARLGQDLRENARAIRETTGRAPLGVAWPFGAHNDETDAIARKEGLEALMDLGDGTFRPEDFPNMPRYLVFHSMRQSDLARQIATHAHNAPPIRGEYLALDGLIGADDAATARNLDAAVAELARRRPSHVMLDVSSKALGPCYPTGYPPAKAGAKKGRDWISHIARALEVHDMFVILRLTERDRPHLDAILKLPVAEDVFLDFPATKEEVTKALGMRTEGHVMARLGGPSNAELFVASGPEGVRPSVGNPATPMENILFWCTNEPALRAVAALGAIHWIGTPATRFNTTKSFMSRPPADPHWLIMPPAPHVSPR